MRRLKRLATKERNRLEPGFHRDGKGSITSANGAPVAKTKHAAPCRRDPNLFWDAVPTSLHATLRVTRTRAQHHPLQPPSLLPVLPTAPLPQTLTCGAVVVYLMSAGAASFKGRDNAYLLFYRLRRNSGNSWQMNQKSDYLKLETVSFSPKSQSLNFNEEVKKLLSVFQKVIFHFGAFGAPGPVYRLPGFTGTQSWPVPSWHDASPQSPGMVFRGSCSGVHLENRWQPGSAQWEPGRGTWSCDSVLSSKHLLLEGETTRSSGQRARPHHHQQLQGVGMQGEEEEMKEGAIGSLGDGAFCAQSTHVPQSLPVQLSNPVSHL